MVVVAVIGSGYMKELLLSGDCAWRTRHKVAATAVTRKR